MRQLVELTSEGKIAVPDEVRKALRLKSGDTLAWEIQKDGKIIVYRPEKMDEGYLSALDSTLSEWNSTEDDEAYRNL